MEILEVNYRGPGYGLTGTLTWEQYRERCKDADKKASAAVRKAVLEGLSWEEFKRRRYG